MTAPSAPAGVCPACSRPAIGRFCTSCGSALGGVPCAGCGTSLSTGARFCHRCGTPADASGTPSPGGAPATPRGVDTALPWAVASIALLALVALLAGQFFNARTGGAPLGAEVTEAPAGPFAGAAPDISRMSPAARADRLFARIVELHERNRPDSVRFFAPMALAAYEMIEAPDAGQRYRLGRIGEVTGVAELVRAQGDSILRQQPTHLLGLILAGSAARLYGSQADARAHDQRLLAAQQAELAKDLPEYRQHEADVVAAIARARRP